MGSNAKKRGTNIFKRVLLFSDLTERRFFLSLVPSFLLPPAPAVRPAHDSTGCLSVSSPTGSFKGRPSAQPQLVSLYITLLSSRSLSDSSSDIPTSLSLSCTDTKIWFLEAPLG